MHTQASVQTPKETLQKRKDELQRVLSKKIQDQGKKEFLALYVNRMRDIDLLNKIKQEVNYRSFSEILVCRGLLTKKILFEGWFGGRLESPLYDSVVKESRKSRQTTSETIAVLQNCLNLFQEPGDMDMTAIKAMIIGLLHSRVTDLETLIRREGQTPEKIKRLFQADKKESGQAQEIYADLVLIEVGCLGEYIECLDDGLIPSGNSYNEMMKRVAAPGAQTRGTGRLLKELFPSPAKVDDSQAATTSSTSHESSSSLSRQPIGNRSAESLSTPLLSSSSSASTSSLALGGGSNVRVSESGWSFFNWTILGLGIPLVNGQGAAPERRREAKSGK